MTTDNSSTANTPPGEPQRINTDPPPAATSEATATAPAPESAAAAAQNANTDPATMPPPLPSSVPNPLLTRPVGQPLPPPQPPTKPRPFATGFGAGFGLALGAGAVALALLIVSLTGFGIVAGIAGRALNTQSNNLTTHIWGPTNAANSLLAVNISGAIAGSGGSMLSLGTYGYEIAAQLDELSADDYDGVVLLMDTPGGSIYGSRAIADAVIRYQERTGHKVVAYVQSMAASGGMYAMAPADRIITDYGTMIGSIGVLFGPFERYREVTGLTGNLLTSGVVTSGGITQEYLSQGTGKDFGNPYRDMTAEERANYTHGLEVEYAQFVDFVAEHRGIPAERIRNELGAFMFDPTTAIEKGLADEILGRPEAFKAAAELNGLDAGDTKVVSPTTPGPFAQLLGAEGRVRGHNIPLSTTAGIKPSSEICVGAPTVLAFAGDFSTVCGS